MMFKRWTWGMISICTMLLAACGASSGNTSAGNSGSSTSTTTTTTTSTTTVSNTPTVTPAPGVTATPGGGSVLHAAIRDIQMADAQNGWGLTTWSNPPGASQQLIHTSDGGHTWADVTPPGYDATPGLLILAAQSATEAWATSNATGQSSTSSATLWHSTDGGTTWQPSTIATSNISVIDFIDAQHGWIISTPDGGVAGPTYFDLWHTTDGGVTWQQLGHAQTFGMGSDISFLTATTGFGTAGIPGNEPPLYVTHDGGHTWSFLTLAVPTLGSPIDYAEANAPIFTSATNGSMAVIYETTAHNYLAVYLTQDGGATWQLSVVEDGRCIPSLHAAAALFVACSQTNTSPISLYHMVGTSWQSIGIASGSQANLVGLLPDGELDMISAGTGWAIANAGLSQTTDGGHTWTVLIPAPPAGS
jgi:photosystem II stability/assembly factor-like uncharacterized protein